MEEAGKKLGIGCSKTMCVLCCKRRGYPGVIPDKRVLPLLVVDNSAFPHIRLTAWETRRILASREVLPSPIFSSEDFVGE